MIDWVSIVRHSRRRFSNYVGTRPMIRMKKPRRTQHPAQITPPCVTTAAHSPQDDRHHYTCCCTHVSHFLRFFPYFSILSAQECNEQLFTKAQ